MFLRYGCREKQPEMVCGLRSNCGFLLSMETPPPVLLVDWFEWDKTPNAEHETVIRECRIRYGKISRVVTIHSNLR